MPQVTLKVEVSDWNALNIRGMSENEVMEEMESVAYDKLRELQDEYGIESDDYENEEGED